MKTAILINHNYIILISMSVVDLFQNTAVTAKDTEGLLAIIMERVNHTMVVYVHVTKVPIKSGTLVSVSQIFVLNIYVINPTSCTIPIYINKWWGLKKIIIILFIFIFLGGGGGVLNITNT